MVRFTPLLLPVFFIVACSHQPTTVNFSQNDPWLIAGQQELAKALEQQPNTHRAKNIILFVGDGMGVSTVTAGRIFDGQSKGASGEENSLSFEQFPYVALSKTYNTNQQTPDSAGTMTAMVTGIKTKAGLISIGDASERANCENGKGKELVTLLEQMEMAGRATGIVSTARITHATPAATYAHTTERDWEDDADMPADAIAAGCKDIASQLIEFSSGDGIDVVLGGGWGNFLANTHVGPAGTGKGNRKDGRDLIQEWQQRYPEGRFVWDREQLMHANLMQSRKLLGLFSRSHMSYEEDRAKSNKEPSLSAMTETAIKLLSNNSEGYFLMVEGGRIDHAHHAGNAYRALLDTQAFAQAVSKAVALTDPDNTLIIVTADHSHVFTIAGYPTRGNPIVGKVIGNDDHGNPESSPELAEDGLPYTTLGYRNGRGYAESQGGDRRYSQAADPGRKNLSAVDVEHPDFHQEALVPLDKESHSGEDVAIYALGPWAHLFHGVHEQSYIYHVMRHAARLP